MLKWSQQFFTHFWGNLLFCFGTDVKFWTGYYLASSHVLSLSLHRARVNGFITVWRRRGRDLLWVLKLASTEEPGLTNFQHPLLKYGAFLQSCWFGFSVFREVEVTTRSWELFWDQCVLQSWIWSVRRNFDMAQAWLMYGKGFTTGMTRLYIQTLDFTSMCR